jgi:type IV pilus modification protein PilV
LDDAVSRTKNKVDHVTGQRGFSMLEVLISMVVLTIGLIGLLSVFAFSLSTTQTAKQDQIAKQLASEAMESVFTARDTANVVFDQIQNVGTGTGIFAQGYQPINNAGNDAILGTGDDATAGLQTMKMPGPDGIMGTADDISISLANYRRQIAIAPVLDATNTQVSNLRQVTVTVQYSIPSGVRKSFVLTGFISQYR